jgi:hypothetical protein
MLLEGRTDEKVNTNDCPINRAYECVSSVCRSDRLRPNDRPGCVSGEADLAAAAALSVYSVFLCLSDEPFSGFERE